MTIDIIARAEARRTDIQAEIVLLNAEIDDRRGELQKMELVIEYGRELLAKDEPPFPDAAPWLKPDGPKPPPLYYPPEKNPELHPIPDAANASPVATVEPPRPTVASHAPETADEIPERSPGEPADPLRSEDAPRKDADATAPGSHAPGTPAIAAAAPGRDAAAVSHPEPKVTREQQIRAVLAEHPDWHAALIAKAIGCPVSTVTGTATLKKITLPKKAVQPSEPVPAPKAPPAPKPATVAPVAPADDAIAPDETVMATSSRRGHHPAGKLFWLRDSEGRYLGRFCDRMVSDRREAWTGTEAQIVGCRRVYEIARDLRDTPVEKEQPEARGYA